MRVLRWVAVFALVLVLGISQASARPGREGAGSREVGNPTRGVFSLLADALARLWSKAGCTIDPLGGCAPAVPESEEGCGIDPWGRCSADPAGTGAD